MLELKTYSFTELSQLLGTNDIQGIKRKLNRYGIIYTAAGRGSNAKFSIEKIPDAFKLFCITELGIPAQSDFKLLRNFFFYYLGDDSFPNLPVDEMAKRMCENGKQISRQTISKWIAYLEKLDYIRHSNTDFIYYKSKIENGESILTEISMEDYKKAWQKYWNCIKNGASSAVAFNKMYRTLDGKPFKVRKAELNGIYGKKITRLFELASESLEQEYGGSTA